jgi:chitinase
MTLFPILTFIFATLVALGESHVVSQSNLGSKVIMCYFSSWSCYRWGNGLFEIENIDPFLCTHLVYGFAGLDKSEYTIKSLDEYNDLEENWGKGAFRKFTNLKNVNPNLKTLLAIGGWNEGKIVLI